MVTTRFPVIHGIARVNRNTKLLLRDLQPNAIAVIEHDDLDDLAAEGLLAAEVQAVVNAGQTMTGKIPATGALRLLEKGIPIFEIEPAWLPVFDDHEDIRISMEGIVVKQSIVPYSAFAKENWLRQYRQALHVQHDTLREFIDNTLHYADMEKNLVLEPLQCPGMRTELARRHVLIVTRGKEYRQDLAALSGYIAKHRPVLVGVDGGADALLEYGHVPDLIIGDMDSATDHALRCGAELIVHAYPDGRAPGLLRIERLGLQALKLAACGTSEDIALLLAYDQHCERIVTVGTHSHMFDFLEKGRKGMGSTVLVRMKVGSKLTDARGIGMLYDQEPMRESAVSKRIQAVLQKLAGILI
ncbi:thiamine pyrophosphokinase [Paenibacillus sp. H1-7]|nr:thiamine pyrophosphokinase [Paenibacillus sp. H1-7]